MQQSTRILLTFIAGFCDTATFIHMSGVFAAHITGNFVLFAAALSQGLDTVDYLKILTFPIFIFAVALTTVLYHRYQLEEKRFTFFIASALILLACSVAAIWVSLEQESIYLGAADIAITVFLVIALAGQNTLHRFTPGPVTTVMTGTVMNTTAAIAEKYIVKQTTSAPAITTTTLNPGWLILSFAIGCLISGLVTIKFGLASILLPAFVMTWVAYQETVSKSA